MARTHSRWMRSPCWPGWPVQCRPQNNISRGRSRALPGGAHRGGGVGNPPRVPSTINPLRRCAGRRRPLATADHSAPSGRPDSQSRHPTASAARVHQAGEATAIWHPLSLHQMGRALAPDLRPERRPMSCLPGGFPPQTCSRGAWTHEVARPGARPRKQRALPPPPEPVVPCQGPLASSGAALPLPGDPPGSDLPARSLRRHLTARLGPHETDPSGHRAQPALPMPKASRLRHISPRFRPAGPRLPRPAARPRQPIPPEEPSFTRCAMVQNDYALTRRAGDGAMVWVDSGKRIFLFSLRSPPRRSAKACTSYQIYRPRVSSAGRPGTSRH